LTLHPKRDHDENLYQTIEGMVFPRTTDESQKLAFDGRISYVYLNKLYNFTLYENKGFVTIQDVSTRSIEHQACLKRQNIPPVHTLVDSLQNARVIDDVKSFDVNCPDGKLLEFKFANEPYVYCNSEQLSATQKVYGHDLDTVLEFQQQLPSRNSLLPPAGLDLASCESLVEDNTSAASTSPSASASDYQQQLQAFQQKARDVFHVATGQRRLAEVDDEDETCAKTCKDGKKACLFVHGLGTEEDKGVLDEYKGYWGEIKRRSTCCSSIKFLHMDTVDNSWFGGKLSQQMCDAAMQMTTSKDKMNLENIALIGHSMGNLIIAAAAMKEQCKIGPGSKWIALQGPMMGSMSATTAMEICKIRGVDTDDSTEQSLLRQLGLCPVKEAVKSLVFMNSKFSTLDTNNYYQQAQEIYRKLVTSNLCGVSPSGLQSPVSSLFAFANTISFHATAINDGVVEFSSCRGGLDESRYAATWKNNQWYKADINHADGRFTNGDGWWGDSRKPIKWFQCQF